MAHQAIAITPRFVRPQLGAELLGVSLGTLWRLLKPLCADCGLPRHLVNDARPGSDKQDRTPRTSCQHCGSTNPSEAPIRSISVGRARLIPIEAIDEYKTRLLADAQGRAS